MLNNKSNSSNNAVDERIRPRKRRRISWPSPGFNENNYSGKIGIKLLPSVTNWIMASTIAGFSVAEKFSTFTMFKFALKKSRDYMKLCMQMHASCITLKTYSIEDWRLEVRKARSTRKAGRPVTAETDELRSSEGHRRWRRQNRSVGIKEEREARKSQSMKSRREGEKRLAKEKKSLRPVYQGGQKWVYTRLIKTHILGFPI